ncbi:chloride channel protein [Aquibium sp. ELW1220]|uniref:chloride channel protein n=1 Tax=Aquibium sp. ELW1220 TaxID=2976766 RepID=UPI0025AFE5C2|nr:chloride channel protein [Aquibium sp. ELW1220]MDN2582430.1 chloride channel protein [Aquibium sp. ELW1220]
MLARLRSHLTGRLGWLGANLRDFRAERQHVLWALALLVGFAAGVVAVLFRELIGLIQLLWIGSSSENTLTAARSAAWWLVPLGPLIAGLAVGILLHRISSRRAGGVADVIEARAYSGRTLGLRDGLWSALVSAITVGGGGSAGREGPIVHLGATLGEAIARRAALPEWCRRTLLSAGVASAVAASFNAPFAGVLFAHEVVLGHYALRSFVPIMLAATAGSLISRQWFGPDAAFTMPDYAVVSYFEFPAFVLLGIVCAAVALLFQLALRIADDGARHVDVPLWLRPAIGGAVVGLIGLAFPQVLGVGYETTNLALSGQLSLGLMLTLIIVKTVTTAITLGSRFGGGIFSPALVVGGLTGAAFGSLAQSVFPDLASSGGLYAILGMGAVAGAVFGAPISTAMIVFELTGGYRLSIALLLTVAVAQGIVQALHGYSWFQWQLRLRGLDLREGPHKPIGANARVMDFMEPLGDGASPEFPDGGRGPALRPTDTLATALRAFDVGGFDRLPVVDPSSDQTIVGWASHLTALQHFNRALVQSSVEEHR